jgi:hypothetical protein
MTSLPLHRERLSPSPAVYLATVLVIPATFLVFLPINVVAGFIVAAALYLGSVTAFIATSPVVRVTRDGFFAGTAHLTPDEIGTVTTYTGGDATQQRGPRLDARAWTLFRGWVHPVVKIELLDDTDPAPYWLVSTRHPDKLAEALAKVAPSSQGVSDAGT